uniref:Dolichyl-diphosphooligosaccharide--protein glycosyltransferase subunit 4A n=5 Tax=Solanaceae TaxID=4070 RepID=A0A3Q7HZU2_SOLLC
FRLFLASIIAYGSKGWIAQGIELFQPINVWTKDIRMETMQDKTKERKRDGNWKEKKVTCNLTATLNEEKARQEKRGDSAMYHSSAPVLQMIDDQDLGFFANFLGIFIFVLVVAYHYVMADPKYEGN